jgi:hypothetical protein
MPPASWFSRGLFLCLVDRRDYRSRSRNCQSLPRTPLGLGCIHKLTMLTDSARSSCSAAGVDRRPPCLRPGLPRKRLCSNVVVDRLVAPRQERRSATHRRGRQGPSPLQGETRFDVAGYRGFAPPANMRRPCRTHGCVDGAWGDPRGRVVGSEPWQCRLVLRIPFHLPLALSEVQHCHRQHVDAAPATIGSCKSWRRWQFSARN